VSKNMKVSIALVVALVAIVAVVALVGRNEEPVETAAGDRTTGAPVLRDDSQRLSDGGDDAPVFVEFLDFECEACGAAFPLIEELRESYGDQVTFVVRNFPLHKNSEAAARAAEAAAAQGEFEAMYVKLFETQTSWAEKSTPQDDVFFGYAEELGLDMAEFRAVYDDPATIAKISRDKEDGLAAGVTGTPTFFLDGEKVQVESFDQLVDQLESAVNR